MKHTREKRQLGFTLIEIIVTLVIVSVAGTMMYTYFGASMTRSVDPLIRLRGALNIQKVMENITADYNNNYVTTHSFGLITLQANISAKTYGQYTVTDNYFIKFVNQAEAPIVGSDLHNLLKVTVKDNTTGESLTALFADPTATS
jgi:prepilin-type N-terminal cleavage/methylation domain-containing protein